jgi:predicted AlkP superfamily phosphohydrolase/phosphomutase
VPADDYESLRNELVSRIEAMPGPDGAPLGNRALKPEEVYRATRGVPPDLIVYFGDLSWRAVGAVGFDGVYTFENDTGPDDANHDYHGIFIMDDGRNRGGEQLPSLHIMNVAPTVLALLGVPIPADFQAAAIP